jgi:hypothetical protein
VFGSPAAAVRYGILYSEHDLDADECYEGGDYRMRAWIARRRCWDHLYSVLDVLPADLVVRDDGVYHEGVEMHAYSVAAAPWGLFETGRGVTAVEQCLVKLQDTHAKHTDSGKLGSTGNDYDRVDDAGTVQDVLCLQLWGYWVDGAAAVGGGGRGVFLLGAAGQTNGVYSVYGAWASVSCGGRLCAGFVGRGGYTADVGGSEAEDGFLKLVA